MHSLGTDLCGMCISVQHAMHKDFEQQLGVGHEKLFDNVCWKHLTFEVGAMPTTYAFRQERGLVEQETLELVYILELCLRIFFTLAWILSRDSTVPTEWLNIRRKNADTRNPCWRIDVYSLYRDTTSKFIGKHFRIFIWKTKTRKKYLLP